MSEAKFTPGPWKVSEAYLQNGLCNNDGCIAVLKGDDDYAHICAVSMQSPAPRRGAYKSVCAERDANAHLIAAGPELYEEGGQSAATLRMAASFLRDHGQTSIAQMAEEQAAKQDAALRKARGEA